MRSFRGWTSGLVDVKAIILCCNTGDIVANWMLIHWSVGDVASNYKHIIYEHLLLITFMGIHFEIALRWMQQNTFHYESKLVQVMAWCRRTTGHYLGQCWPWSLYDVTWIQWVNSWELCVYIITKYSLSSSYSTKRYLCENFETWKIYATLYCYHCQVFFMPNITLQNRYRKLPVELMLFHSNHAPTKPRLVLAISFAISTVIGDQTFCDIAAKSQLWNFDHWKAMCVLRWLMPFIYKHQA